MKLVVQSCNLNNAITLYQKIGVDGVIVGNSKFASRLPGNFVLNDLKILKNQNINFIVSVNNIFSEPQLVDLKQYLLDLKAIGVSTLIFSDYAVYELNEELKLKFNLIYNPETLVTSYGQLDFYNQLNITRVCLARELLFNEIKQIGLNNNTNVELEIQCHGLSFIMQSRWQLLTNYKNYSNQLDLNINQEANLIIKEKLRNLGNYIYEDENGTHMLTGFELQTIDMLDKLNTCNIAYLRIDSVMKNQAWIEKVATIYKKGLNAILNNTYNNPLKQELLNELQTIDCKTILAHGFLDGPLNNPHFQK